MTRDDWPEIDRLLDAVLDLPEAKREGELFRLCPEAVTRARVLEMLRNSEGIPGRIHSLIEDSSTTLLHTQTAPKQLGPYTLIREIGTGGMGSVWLAERSDGQFQRKVAIKRIRHVLATPEMKTRFRNERQILAGLQHPNIAQLVDGGESEDGTPYLVLEFIDGIDLARHAEKLPVTEKLALFLKVCSAVEYAHRNLIVHRDLKMSNILVTPDGDVKLLDFGIAKVLEVQLAPGETAATETQIMTPEYASPEQALARPVTTLSDVYSLGAVLYVLLAGRSPYRTSTSSPAELIQAVANQQVTPPVPENGKLPNELSVIVLKAMRKEPERRYQSVAELAADIRSFLDGRPIAAQPDSFLYRFRKFTARNPFAVAASAVAVCLLIAFVATTIVQSRRLEAERDAARRERDNAQWLSRFLVGVFRVADPREGAGEKVTARELLDRGAKRLADEPPRDELRALMSTTMGRAYAGLGLLPAAEKSVLTAYEAAKASRSPDALLAALGALESVYTELAQGDKLLAYASEHLTVAQAKTPGDSLDAAQALSAQGTALDLKRDFDSARAKHTQGIEMLERLHMERSTEMGVALNSAANVEYNQGSATYPAALDLAKRSVEILRVTGPPEQLMSSLNSVAVVSMTTGDHKTAEPAALEGLALTRKMFGPRHLNVAFNYNNLCGMYTLMKRLDQALPYCEQAVELRREGYPPDHRLIGISLNNLGKARLAAGKTELAGSAYREAYPILARENGGPAARSAEGIALALKARGDFAGSARYFREALERWEKLGNKNVGDLQRQIAEVEKLGKTAASGR